MWERLVASCTWPDWRPNPQPRYVPLIGNRTHNLLVFRTTLQPTDPPGQGHIYVSFFAVVQVQLTPFLHPPLPPTPPIPTSHPWSYSPLALSMGPLYMFLDNPSPLPPIILLPSSLWLLSVYSLSQYPWLYFASLFVLLVMFQLKVRSYGICLSPPGSFHLA